MYSIFSSKYKCYGIHHQLRYLLMNFSSSFNLWKKCVYSIVAYISSHFRVDIETKEKNHRSSICTSNPHCKWYHTVRKDQVFLGEMREYSPQKKLKNRIQHVHCVKSSYVLNILSLNRFVVLMRVSGSKATLIARYVALHFVKPESREKIGHGRMHADYERSLRVICLSM